MRMKIKPVIAIGFFLSITLLSFTTVSNPSNIVSNAPFGKSLGRKSKWELAMEKCQGIQNIATTKKVVALTFDDGPHAIYTDEILTILKSYHIHATFFVIGENAKRYPDQIKKAYADGNVIGNHSYTHPNLTSLDPHSIELELTKTSDVVDNAASAYPLLFRPPYGICNNKTVTVAKELGYKTILWDDMTDDYHVRSNSPTLIASHILHAAHPGSIIVLHDGGGLRGKTVIALLMIITELKKDGYEFLTIPELLSIEPYRKSKHGKNT